MSQEESELVRAVAKAAAAWRDPGFPPRADAVERTLTCDNRFTPEAIAFAINQQVHQLTAKRIVSWLRGRCASGKRVVGVLNAGNVPFVGLRDFLAVSLTGHAYRGVSSSKSPFLLPAFTDTLREYVDLDAAFVPLDEILSTADMIIGTGSDETRTWLSSLCDDAGIMEERRLLRGSGYGVAILDGEESEDELEALAEDALLHEGLGCRNVALIFAPEALAPDGVLAAFANFRGVFPAHPGTPGTLRMSKAFLEAIDAPHAYGDGLEFLLSKGEAEVQQPAHVRWSTYTSLHDVVTWINERAEIQVVTARTGILSALEQTTHVELLGNAQRPSLDWNPDGRDVVDFLTAS